MEKLRILVVDDKEMHREAARETLGGHEVLTVSSYDEAIRVLGHGYDYHAFDAEFQKRADELGLPREYPRGSSDELLNRWRQLHEEVKRELISTFEPEVVLTDMMMPMSEETLGPGVFNPGEQVPYGLVIVLKAALCGVKFVAMVTDTNHHKGAMSAALDHLGSAYYNERDGFTPNFVINGARAMFVHAPFITENGVRTNKKNWGKVLEDLTQVPEKSTKTVA